MEPLDELSMVMVTHHIQIFAQDEAHTLEVRGPHIDLQGLTFKTWITEVDRLVDGQAGR